MADTHEALAERLRILVAEYSSFGRLRLPAVPLLCRILGCSPVTLGKAVGKLAHEGLLSTSTGRGTLISPGGSAPTSLNAPVARREAKSGSLSERMKTDLYGGSLSDTPLPSLKELSARYRVCYRTVRAALDLLVRERFLSRRGTRHFAELGRRRSSSGVVRLILHGHPDQPVSFVTSRTHEHLRAAEQQCSQLGIRLELVPYFSLEQTDIAGLQRTVVDTPEDSTLLGVFIWNVAIGWTETLLRLASMAVAGGRPVSILDEYGTHPGFEKLRPHPLLRVYSLAVSEAAGKDVARYLLGRGHRDIAFFHPYQDPTTRNDRLAGILHEYAGAGMPADAVSAYADEYRAPRIALDQERWWTGVRTQKLLSALGAGTIPADTGLRLRESVTGVARNTLLSAGLREMLATWFAKTLAHSKATAWVCYNDSVAVEAMEFLRQHKVDVPGRISVVGFDDSIEASAGRFTSYTFNGLAAIRAGLDHVLRPYSSGKPEGLLIEEVPGFIDERGSVAIVKHVANVNRPT